MPSTLKGLLIFGRQSVTADQDLIIYFQRHFEDAIDQIFVCREILQRVAKQFHLQFECQPRRSVQAD